MREDDQKTIQIANRMTNFLLNERILPELTLLVEEYMTDIVLICLKCPLSTVNVDSEWISRHLYDRRVWAKRIYQIELDISLTEMHGILMFIKRFRFYKIDDGKNAKEIAWWFDDKEGEDPDEDICTIIYGKKIVSDIRRNCNHMITAGIRGGMICGKPTALKSRTGRKCLGHVKHEKSKK